MHDDEARPDVDRGRGHQRNEVLAGDAGKNTRGGRMSIRQVIRAFRDEEAGITSTECAVFMALVVVVVLTATALLGGRLSALASYVAGGISDSTPRGTTIGGRWVWTLRL
jgi:Flp pilus assembly pilin Flp